MQSLPQAIKMKGPKIKSSTLSDGCAEAVLNVAPPVVRAIRKMMREHRLPELSVPQFRALAILSWTPDASLSIVADFIGSSLPATSRMIDALVAKNLVARKQCCHDRRQVSLELTSLGREAFQESRQATRQQLIERLSSLSPEKKESVIEAMQWLGEVFGTDANLTPQAALESATEDLAEENT
jgi:DNA-binding MarR family transcriptional regulator